MYYCSVCQILPVQIAKADVHRLSLKENKTAKSINLGKGKIVFALAEDNCCTWILFRFSSSSDEEPGWFCTWLH
jgi:hypothetical protein